MGPARGRARLKARFPQLPEQLWGQENGWHRLWKGVRACTPGTEADSLQRVSNTEPTPPAQVGHRRSSNEMLPPQEAAGGEEGWEGLLHQVGIKEAKARAEGGCAAG